MKASACIEIFNHSILEYHKTDDVNTEMPFFYQPNTIEHLMFKKNWIDTVQWHLEDIIRDPNILPEKGMEIKRRIDASNQDRTDTVEYIDDYYINLFKDVEVQENVFINTESPAWVVDRLSILCLKIFHMQEQVERNDVDATHLKKCQQKLEILLDQQKDLSSSFDQLLDDYAQGKKRIKVYRQMKMYNDDSLNPMLYKNK